MATYKLGLKAGPTTRLCRFHTSSLAEIKFSPHVLQQQTGLEDACSVTAED